MEKINSKIEEEEVRKARKESKNKKAAGEDGIVAEFLNNIPRTLPREKILMM